MTQSRETTKIWYSRPLIWTDLHKSVESASLTTRLWSRILSKLSSSARTPSENRNAKSSNRECYLISKMRRKIKNLTALKTSARLRQTIKSKKRSVSARRSSSTTFQIRVSSQECQSWIWRWISLLDRSCFRETLARTSGRMASRSSVLSAGKWIVNHRFF